MANEPRICRCKVFKLKYKLVYSVEMYPSYFLQLHIICSHSNSSSSSSKSRSRNKRLCYTVIYIFSSGSVTTTMTSINIQIHSFNMEFLCCCYNFFQNNSLLCIVNLMHCIAQNGEKICWNIAENMWNNNWHLYVSAEHCVRWSFFLPHLYLCLSFSFSLSLFFSLSRIPIFLSSN